MAYEKQNFVDGQTLSAANLNQIEDAIVELENGSSGGSAVLPENVVTCDLEGATEDESAVPVNADTLGGEPPENYVKASDMTGINITESVTVDAGVKSNYSSFWKLGKIVFCNLCFQLASAPATWSQTTIFSGLPNASGEFFGTIAPQESAHAKAVFIKGESGEIKIQNGAVSAGTNFYRGQLTYICAESEMIE